ncbi:hypothetical protein HU200_057963 [Digitaria exilis]|uniref:Cytochrome P450 n=1 Tax=Digitaria exilis TaxID=1010633 RepID=A0A835AAR0_9POAL|nr:hypothetical protein HU200_057963 [Digitaria exilis]
MKPSSKARGSGVLLPLPPSPPSMPVVGPLLWLLRARNRLEPAIRELHRRHGPVLALRFLSPRPSIFVSGRGATHRALVQLGPSFASRPPAIAPFRVLTSEQSTVSSAPHGPIWRSLRRNLAAGVLSPSRVQFFAPARRRTMALLVSDIGGRSEEGGGEVDVLGYMCFGQWLHGRRVGEIEAVQRQLFASYISFQVFAFFPAVTKLVFRRRWRKVLSIRRRQEELFLPLIRARRDRDSSMPKPNNNLPKSKEESERMLTDGEMVSLCTEFFTASVDTTVTALQWIMANLVIQPDVQAGGPEEHAVPEGGGAGRAPAHFLLSHAAAEEASLDGYSIPAATPVNFSVPDVSMDEVVWERPSEFRPERFMDGGEGAGVDLTGSREMRMMPFGAGRRICPGLGLAMLHLECFVATLVSEFEWRAVAGVGVDLAERPEFTVTMDRPLRARVVRRRRDAVSI